MRQTVLQPWAYCVAAALSLLAIPNAVPAADYYLANKPGSGSGTKDDPFGLADLPNPDNKPTRPLTVLQPGDTLWFQGGEYAFHTGPVKDVNLTRYGPAGRTATTSAADAKVHRGLAYASRRIRSRRSISTLPPTASVFPWSSGFTAAAGIGETKPTSTGNRRRSSTEVSSSSRSTTACSRT